MEFFQSIKEKLDDDFEEIQIILNLMKRRNEVIGVDFHINYLQKHFPNRAICTLDDKKNLRKYMVGRIRLKNGLEAMVIEIQREKKSISTMLCISQFSQKSEKLVHRILKSFIIKSGIWPDIEKIWQEDLVIWRLKHTQADPVKKENRIFQKILDYPF